MSKGSWQIVAIALLGLVLALALGAFAHTIARGTVALPATTLERAGADLAPAQAKQVKPASKPKPLPQKRKAARPAGTTTLRTTGTVTTTDDGDSSGRGSDDSGGDSSGSGNSGKGSDEPEVEDD